MNKKAIAWLYAELPKLVDKGILSADAADRIKQYYGPTEKTPAAKTFLLLFSLVGAVLMGLGIILILAHNWENLNRPVRLIIAVGLLAATQLVTGLVIRFKFDNTPCREGAATLQILTLGAAMALVGQTYHLTEDTSAFLLTWLFLVLPLAYLLNSTSSAVLYTVGVNLWAMEGTFYPGKQIAWLLLILILPYFFRLFKQDPYANSTAVLGWTLNISLYICFAATLNHYAETFGLLIYGALLAVNYMLGVKYFSDAPAAWRAPFKVIGLGGSVGWAFLLTFNGFWQQLQFTTIDIVEATLVISLLIAVARNIIQLARQQRRYELAFAFIPIAVNFAYLLQLWDPSGTTATLLMNAYVLFIGIHILRAGARNFSMGRINLGMLIIIGLILARFFDANFSFIIRGLVFVTLGLPFLFTNLVLARRQGRQAGE